MHSDDIPSAVSATRRPISRRTFVKGAGALAAGATLLALGAQFVPDELATVPGASLMRSTFLGYLGSTFTIAPEGAPASRLRLVELHDLPGLAATEAQREQSFALLFRSTGSRPLAQGTYQFQQHGIGRFTIFIVPTSNSAEASYYEAIFNRLPIE